MEDKTPAYLSAVAGACHHTRHRKLSGMTRAELSERVLVVEEHARVLDRQLHEEWAKRKNLLSSIKVIDLS